jgi:3-deoxy-7-phosphoheptulonate synthase
MLVVMEHRASEEQIQAVLDQLADMGFNAELLPGSERTAIGIMGNAGYVDADALIQFPGVKELIHVTKPYKLVSREFHPENTIVDVNGVKVGEDFVVIAGPCSVENEEQLLKAAHGVKEAGATLLRGGAYKPRTGPYSFQGLGLEGLKLLAKAREATGLPVVTELLSVNHLDDVANYADVLQIGARNMQNFELLKAIGKTKKPILLKRGMAAKLDEFLLAAEYILNEGNPNVILCERGIRTFETATRNTLDLNIVPLVKELSHLPILVDPSHGTGIHSLVKPLSKAARAVGADGLIIEVHPNPSEALSDGKQSLNLDKFTDLMTSLNQMRV